MADPAYTLLLLDELNIVLRYDYLPIDEIVATLKARRPISMSSSRDATPAPS